MTTIKDDRGVALLLVVLVVTLLTAVIVDFSFKTRLDSRISGNVRDALIASSLAHSGFNVAIGVLMDDAGLDAASGAGRDNQAVSDLVNQARRQAGLTSDSAGEGLSQGVDFLQEAWARMDLLRVPLESNQSLQVNVKDLAGRINLNAIITRNQAGAEQLNKPLFEQLVTLLEQALEGIGDDDGEARKELSAEEIAYAIADWVDSDEIRLSDGSFEDQVYNSLADAYSSKNGPFDSVAELQLVEGVDDALFAAIQDAVTVYPFQGGGAINVNTASPGVLRSIRMRENRAIESPEPLSDESIDRILEARDQGISIRSEQELRELIGVDAAAVFTPDLVYGSNFFAIESVAKANETYSRLQAVVDRSPGGPRLLYWRVE